MTSAAHQIEPIALKGPFDFPDSPLSRAAEQPLMLGVFLNLQDIGTSIYPTANTWTFDAEGIVAGRPPAKGTGFGGTRAYDSDAHAWRGRLHQTNKPGLNLGGNIEIIGSPEQVVEQLVALKATGIDGIQLSFYDFAPDLAYFGERILPLLKQAGLCR